MFLYRGRTSIDPNVGPLALRFEAAGLVEGEEEPRGLIFFLFIPATVHGCWDGGGPVGVDGLGVSPSILVGCWPERVSLAVRQRFRCCSCKMRSKNGKDGGKQLGAAGSAPGGAAVYYS